MVISQTAAENFPLKFQPEMDNINIEEYLRDEKAMERQVQCVLNGGTCDAIGRWIKPRVTAAFLGECPMCTPKQQQNMKRIMDYMQKNRPIEYRMAVVQFLIRSGINARQ